MAPEVGGAICSNGIVVMTPGSSSRTAVNAEKETDVEKIVEDLKSKLDSIEDKPRAALIAGGAVLAVTVANGVVSTIDNLPALPGLMKLIGTSYSLWFAYRNLLFEDNRKELSEDLDNIWKKITG
eukprot:CAMPEP_0170166698 /NCGR_PEP_ID=MMETSP0040_2-20121228/314_1 /TAXON_ID=641309 /ORGANISM="Lotharella oceanica, Strain CCMP622" /LENGTH=124 /DNA_ID=CAMNT_0010404497 /DNA_START=271 /DNA_END=645 /DNA_ORIENTATION=+